MANLKFYIAFVVLVFSFTAFSALEEIRAVRIDNISEDVLPDQPDGELSISYDPKAVDQAPLLFYSEAELLNEIETKKTDAYRNLLKTAVVIPLAPSTVAGLEQYIGLNSDSQEIFLSKKALYLQKIKKILIFFQMPYRKINLILSRINDAFFKNAFIVSQANAQATTISLATSGGIGLSEGMMRYLKKSPLLKGLPDSVGFYFMFSFGLSLVKTVKNGKIKLGLEPVIEIHRATKIFSPFAYLTGGLAFNKSFEDRNYDIHQATFYRISALSSLSGQSLFDFSISGGLTFPIGGGSIAGATGHAFRIPINKQTILLFYKKALSYLDFRPQLLCRQIF